MNNSRSVKVIPLHTWNKVVAVFPDAIKHEIQPPSEQSVGNCVQCYEAKQEKSRFPVLLNEWKTKAVMVENETQPNQSLSDLFWRGQSEDSSKNYPSEIDVLLQEVTSQSKPSGTQDFLVLHHKDVQRWRDSVAIAINAEKSKKKSDNTKKQLKELLFISSGSSLNGREWKFRPLVCSLHKMAIVLPVQPGITSASEEGVVIESSVVRNWLESCRKSNLELVHVHNYRCLVESLSSLETILYGSRSSLPEQSMFPSVSLSACDGNKLSLKISPQIGSCNCNVAIFEGDHSDEEQCSDQCKPGKNGAKESNECSSDENESPICTIRVHEIEDFMNVEVAASKIVSDLSISSGDEPSSSSNQRRSRRKRSEQGEFPAHKIEISPHGNLAHLRLLLHESTSKKLLGQRLFLLLPSILPSAGDSSPVHEMVHGQNGSSLCEIIREQSCLDEAGIIHKMKEKVIHLIMSYNDGESNELSEGRPNSRRRQTPTEQHEENAIMSSLTEVAFGGWEGSDNIYGGSSDGKKNPRTRKVERGFRGTFLQSSSTMSSAKEERTPLDYSESKAESEIDLLLNLRESSGPKGVCRDSAISMNNFCPTKHDIGSDEIVVVDSAVTKEENASNHVHGNTKSQGNTPPEKGNSSSHALVHSGGGNYDNSENLSQQVVEVYFQNQHLISDMVRNGIEEIERRRVIIDEVRQFDVQILSYIRSALHEHTSSSATSQPNPQNYLASSASIQHEIKQRILHLIEQEKSLSQKK